MVEFDQTEPDQVVERLRDATIAIVNKLPLRHGELTRLPKLRLIAVAATGVDNIDLEYCRAHDILVSNTRNYAAHSLRSRNSIRSRMGPGRFVLPP